MNDIRVISPDTLEFKGRRFRCTIGKHGFMRDRTEGSGTTPIGRYPLRECWYRPDRVQRPNTILPIREITPSDGWCDDANHPRYNRAVKLPFDGSHEQLWREEDGMYDIIVPLGFNDAPVMPGRGSAIFFHLAKPDYSPTVGCVAIILKDMQELLSHIGADTQMQIAPIYADGLE